jgi:two-component system sensor histidine kinase KdpD
MFYLVGVVLVAARFGRGPSVLAAALSVVAFDFFFVPPRFTFVVTDTQYLVVFGSMLIVGLLISSLVVRVRQHAELSRERELRTATLYRMSRELSLADGESEIVRIAEEAMAELLGAEVWVLLPGPDGRLVQGTGVTSAFPLSERELSVAEWVFKHGKRAGEGTSTLPGSNALYMPLVGSQGGVGVLGIFASSGRAEWTAEQMHLIEALASQMALVLERVALGRNARAAELASETEKLRNTVLSSLSHDLRTPLAVIAGATSSLLHDEDALDSATRHDLLESVWDESDRLNRLVGNLLSISRMEAGGLTPRRDWYPLEEVIGSTLRYLERRLHGRRVEVHFPRELPLVHIDDVMIEQVLVNLVDNALRYAPGDTPIEIAADVSNAEVIVRVSDQGPGIPEGREEMIFERFHRAGSDRVPGGIGLGLTICRGIIAAHGGRIWASNRERGGAVIAFSLPAGEVPE